MVSGLGVSLGRCSLALLVPSSQDIGVNLSRFGIEDENRHRALYAGQRFISCSAKNNA